jgi:hypothetical protein
MRNTDLDGVACGMGWLVQENILALNTTLVRIPLSCQRVLNSLGWLVLNSLGWLVLNSLGWLVLDSLDWLVGCCSVHCLQVVSTSGYQQVLNSLDWLVDCCSVQCLLVVSTSECQRVLDSLDY